ncbi:plasma-membrane proton-efflux P-type ATPase [Halteromyces radiatus]|uniref:plasma-membrane proton-efflux P-type ATPase n=1 Tax=Halteromyces radiatus TaxID=101107 RepID=UPI002220DB1F|nr:plasma-membrane proton-efflux P-type ATPase [Halteromyces radiatus]KAI8076308.1 plasma-membrane proton-efflux P-type ATPase [Halteromyces radiatus]
MEEAVPLTNTTTTQNPTTGTEKSTKGWVDEISPHMETYLQTQPTYGLTHEQVTERLAQFGRNELVEKKRNKILHFLSFFTGAIAYLMLLSIILTAVTKDWIDFGIILGMLIVNAIIGYVEESRAESAVASLQQSLALKTKCWRQGQLMDVDAAELVVGDIVILRLGDIIPADCRLLGIGVNGEHAECDLQVDQSALTGESLLVKKRKNDIVYSSCIVKQGQQQAVVVRTGPHSFIGRAASLITVTTDGGHFQKVINYIGNFLIIATVFLVTIIFIFDLVEQKIRTGFVSGDHVLAALNEMVVLTVAAIPVGLPTIMSVTMAIGAKQLAKRQVIIKRLTAVEELASVSILCSDKTGTLTMNQLTFDEPYLREPYSKNDLLLYAYLASERGTKDPIEMAVRAATESSIPTIIQQGHIPGYEVISFNPFNPNEKMSQATIQQQQDDNTTTTFRVAKGAPQVILQLVGGDTIAEQTIDAFATRGLRALGVARTTSHDEGWELVGLFSLIDPPRHDSASTIQECAQYGISVKMITGDQTVIAQEVAGRLGMGQHILDADHLVDSSISEHQLALDCLHADGFARVIPEHKYRVIELLQNQGYFVAMTGDGVNDAAALKKANVGIAVEGSTDAARSASDVVLLEPGLSAIIEAVKTSRVIFHRLHSYALYRIASTIHFLLFFFVITLAEDWQMPPVFLILISVLNDAATLIMAVDNVKISKQPQTWRLPLLIFLSCVLAILLAGISFGHFYIFRDVLHVSPGQLSTIMYLHISSAPHFVIFSTRVNGFCWKSLPSWPFTLVVLGTQVIALILSVYGMFGQNPNIEGIGWSTGLIILAISLATFLLTDIVKVATIRLWDRMKIKRQQSKQPLSIPLQEQRKDGTRAQRFIQKQEGQRSRSGYDRAQRRGSNTSVQSY